MMKILFNLILRKRNLLYLIVLHLCLFFSSCSEDMIGEDLSELEIKESAQDIDPETRKILVDFQMAIKSAARVTGDTKLMEIMNDPNRFTYTRGEDDQSEEVKLTYSPSTLFGVFSVNTKKMQEFTSQGYIFIALHELFHVKYGGMTNDKDHEAMVVSLEFRKWIRFFLDCSWEEARILSYWGTGDSVSKNMSPEEWGKLTKYQKELLRKYKLTK